MISDNKLQSIRLDFTIGVYQKYVCLYRLFLSVVIPYCWHCFQCLDVPPLSYLLWKYSLLARHGRLQPMGFIVSCPSLHFLKLLVFPFSLYVFLVISGCEVLVRCYNFFLNHLVSTFSPGVLNYLGDFVFVYFWAFSSTQNLSWRVFSFHGFILIHCISGFIFYFRCLQILLFLLFVHIY